MGSRAGFIQLAPVKLTMRSGRLSVLHSTQLGRATPALRTSLTHEQVGKGAAGNKMSVMWQKCKLALPSHVLAKSFSLPMSQDSMIVNSMCTHFKGPWWLSVSTTSFHSKARGEEDLKHRPGKLWIAFRPIHTISGTPDTSILSFHYTTRYNGPTKKWH